MQPLDGAICHADRYFHIEHRLVLFGSDLRLLHHWPERFKDLTVEHAGIRLDLFRRDAQNALGGATDIGETPIAVCTGDELIHDAMGQVVGELGQLVAVLPQRLFGACAR